MEEWLCKYWCVVPQGELLISASLSLEKQGRLEWKINPTLLSCGDVVFLRGCGISARMWYSLSLVLLKLALCYRGGEEGLWASLTGWEKLGRDFYGHLWCTWDKDKRASSLSTPRGKISHHTVGRGENSSPGELTQGFLTQSGEGGPMPLLGGANLWPLTT